MTDVAPLLICPLCQSQDGMHFTDVPEHRRTWSADDDGAPVEHIHYWGECYDVKCLNCDFEFTCPKDDEDGR